MTNIKTGEERRKEILLIARNLFVHKGFDQTSINDIIRISRIAKGTFYYYFSSKEEVLHEIIMEIVYEVAVRAEYILKDTSIPLIKRIVLAVMAQAPEFEGAHKIAEELHRVENAKLEQQYRKAMLKKMTSVLEGVVKEANEQGIFHTDFPKECIESVLLMGHMMMDCDTFEWSSEEYPVKVQAFLYNAERMFGAKDGDFQVLMEMFQKN